MSLYGDSFKVIETGSVKVAQLHARLDRVGRRDLARKLRQELVKQSKPARRLVKRYQQEKLPSGMDRSYAKVPSQLVSVNKSGVKLLWKVVRGNSDLKALNRGRLRHPLFGNRKHWYEQSIPPGMWDDAIGKVAPTVIGDTADVLEAFVEKEVMRG